MSINTQRLNDSAAELHAMHAAIRESYSNAQFEVLPRAYMGATPDVVEDRRQKLAVAFAREVGHTLPHAGGLATDPQARRNAALLLSQLADEIDAGMVFKVRVGGVVLTSEIPFEF